VAQYRKVDSRIWNDAKFRSLTNNGKLCFFFLLTHPHMTALGAMRASLSGLSEELGWTPKAFREAFGEAFAKGLVKHDRKACFVWLPNFLKYNRPESPNVVKAWAKSLDLLPECEHKNELIQNVKDFAEALPEAFAEALPEAFAKGMPYQEQEQEQEQKEDIRRLAPTRANGVDNDFHMAIVATYHELCPELPHVRDWTERRKKKLQARIRDRVKAGKPADQIAYWRSFFEKAAASDFLCGRKTDWRCGGIEWLLEPKNFTKVIEGGFDNVGGSRGNR